jgi:hypothetical protein
MKNLSSSVVKMSIAVVAILSLIVAVNAGQVALQPKKENNAPTDFYANITVKVFEGDGCECVPLGGSFVNATGRDTDHNDFNVTNDRGECVLHLQFDKTYRVNIQIVDHESVLYDFNVLNDQTFVFNLKKTSTSSDPVPSAIQLFLHKVTALHKLLNR